MMAKEFIKCNLKIKNSKCEEESLCGKCIKSTNYGSKCNIRIMIITFSVFIFGIFKDYNAKNTSQIEEKEDSRFNSEFFKYYENGKDVLKVTPHDIVSIANFAKRK